MRIHPSCLCLAIFQALFCVMLMLSWTQHELTLEYRYPPSLSGWLSLFQSSSVYSFPFCGPAVFLATAGQHSPASAIIVRTSSPASSTCSMHRWPCGK